MKKYYIDEVVCFTNDEGKKDFIRGFYLTVDEDKARLEVPSDIYGDSTLLYEEEIPIETQVFQAAYESGRPVHIDDGELLGEEE